MHGNVIQGIYALHTPLIMLVTQRGMCLDSRTTNRAFPCMMAQGTKDATSLSNVCKASKHERVPNLYHFHLKRPSMHAYAMQL